jgi:hypothetical protein
VDEQRPWAVPVNQAAYKRRHVMLNDGRNFYVIVPLAILGIAGWFVNAFMIGFLGLAIAAWVIGFFQWQASPWYLTRTLVNLESPRRGPATRRRAP